MEKFECGKFDSLNARIGMYENKLYKMLHSTVLYSTLENRQIWKLLSLTVLYSTVL